MNYINLIDTFDREIEVLEINDEAMIYAMDMKNEIMDLCSIGRYDFASDTYETLLTLDYARLYESFQSYGQNKSYFYCVNVLQDYRLRLRRISKLNWEQEGEVHLCALGEIVNFYMISEQYLLIVDEVTSTDEYKKTYHIDSDDTYINLVYLYDCFSQKRYPVIDSRLHGELEQIILDEQTDTLIIAASYAEGAVNSAIYTVAIDDFIEAVMDETPLFLDVIAEGSEDSIVTYFENDNKEFIYKVTGTSEEKMYRHDMSTGADELITDIQFDDSERLLYDPWTYDVYDVSLADPDTDEVLVNCLNHPEKSFAYHDAEGEFSGVVRDDLFLSTFYKEVKVKEYEFHENVAVHSRIDGSVTSFEGRYTTWKDKVILLRTFLAL